MRDEIDFVYEVPPEAAEFVEASTDIQAHSFLRSFVHLLGFNVAHPLLRDVRVRRAIGAAIDRQAIISQAFGGRGVPAYGTVWLRHWAYDASIGGEPERHSPLAARKVLEKALGSRSRPASDAAALLTISCILPGGYPTFERSALVLQRQLAQIGVDLRPEVLSVSELTSRFAKGEFDTYLFEQRTGLLNWTYWFWHSPGEAVPLIQSGYTAADETLDRIRRADNQIALRAAIHDLQRLFVTDPPAIFLAWSETTRAVGPRFAIPRSPGRDIFALVPQWRPPPDGALE
jgi:ABC-type transport system substrate-binding protein